MEGEREEEEKGRGGQLDLNLNSDDPLIQGPADLLHHPGRLRQVVGDRDDLLLCAPCRPFRRDLLQQLPEHVGVSDLL